MYYDYYITRKKDIIKHYQINKNEITFLRGSSESNGITDKSS